MIFSEWYQTFHRLYLVIMTKGGILFNLLQLVKYETFIPDLHFPFPYRPIKNVRNLQYIAVSQNKFTNTKKATFYDCNTTAVAWTVSSCINLLPRHGLFSVYVKSTQIWLHQRTRGGAACYLEVDIRGGRINDLPKLQYNFWQNFLWTIGLHVEFYKFYS